MEFSFTSRMIFRYFSYYLLCTGFNQADGFVILPRHRSMGDRSFTGARSTTS